MVAGDRAGDACHHSPCARLHLHRASKIAWTACTFSHSRRQQDFDLSELSVHAGLNWLTHVLERRW